MNECSGAALSARGELFLLVGIDGVHECDADRHIVLQAEVIPHSLPRHASSLLHERQPPRIVAFHFQLAKLLRRLEQGDHGGAQNVAGAYHPRGNAVDARVEKVEPNMYPVEVPARYYL